MTSDSSLSDHQFEGGGPIADNRQDKSVINEAQQILTTLYDLRNPEVINNFDFTDPHTGEVREYFDNGLNKEEKLQQVQALIERLKVYVQNKEQSEDSYEEKERPKAELLTKSQVQREVDEEFQDNSLPAGDEFLIWEPRGIVQKVSNFFQNMIEVYMFLIIGLVAYGHPSINAIVYLLLTFLLFHSMTKDIKDRYKWNMLFLTIILVYMIVATTFKFFFAKKKFKEGRTFTMKEYKEVVNDLLKMGFIFEWDRTVFTGHGDKTRTFKLGASQFMLSYDIEIVTLFCTIVLFIYSVIKHFRIQKLTKISRKDFIDYINLIDPPEEEEDVDPTDAELAEMEIGVSNRIRNKQKIEEAKLMKEQKAKQDLKRLKKEIKTNIVGSNRFYKYNQIFFSMALLTTLLESVTFNSLSCVPGMILILGLAAMYDLRKKYSRYYRTYTFNVAYWIQYIMLTKLCVDIFVSIETVNIRLNQANDEIDQYANKFYQILFGEIHSIKELQDTENISIPALFKFLCIFISTYCIQGWKTCKWFEIRDKTPDCHSISSAVRFYEYIKVREREDQDELKLIDIKESKDKKKVKKLMEESVEKDLKTRRHQRYDSGNVTKKARKYNSQVSNVVILLAQILMFLLAYMYHSSAGFVCLCWVIASFMLDTNNTLFISIVFMIPVLSLEFIFIYSSNVPQIKDTAFFQSFGKFFRFDMAKPLFEQFFMLITLMTFYFMIAAYIKRVDNVKTENRLIRFFKDKIKNKKVGWIWVFFSLRWIHVIILISLFIKGILNLNCINNLGYMGFFAIYTAYEDIYRKTGRILILFSSIFILGQYFYSLHYQIYMQPNNKERIENLYWWNMFPYQYQDIGNPMSDPFHIKEGESLYFRVAPHFEEWSNVLLMKALIEINIMYTTERVSEYRLRQDAKQVIAEKSGKLGYYFARVMRIVIGIFNYVVIVSLVLVQGIVQPSIITWLFLCLNMLNLAFMVKGSTKVYELKFQYWVSNIIKIYSLLVIIANVFVLAYGHQIDHDEEWKDVKNWLQIVGLKANGIQLGVKPLTEEQIEEIEMNVLRNRMLAMIIFFLASMYLTSHFSGRIKQAAEDQDFGENDYKKLFEFRLGQKKSKEIDSDLSNQEDNDDSSESDRIGDETQESIYKKRKYYYQQDLIDFYEGVRFTIPFIVYRWIEYWYIMDFIAKYANIVVSVCYIYVCFYMKVNLFNVFNLFLLVTYFFNVTIRVGQRAENIQKVSSVQSQCDIQLARIVTKRYKKETFYEFLVMRKKIWRYMFGLLIVASLLQYPTPIIDKIRKMHLSVKQRQQLNEAVLFLFYTGIYVEQEQITMLGVLILGLALERFSINWLQNRFGCTHFKLQKFTELDVRRDAERRGWDIVNPTYDIEKYRRHYFRNDFNDLKLLMQNQTHEEMIRVKKMQEAMMTGLGGQLAEQAESGGKKKNKYKKTLYGDYVPYKVGMRIVQTVRFSTMLDCLSKDLNIDDQAKKMIHRADVDYETVPVLKSHKVNALLDILKEAVDRKYKISFYKGIQLWLESVIIFLLTISLIAKANIWSIVYLIFIFKFSCTRNKTNLMVRQCSYLCISLVLQYLLFFLNMTAQSTIQPFPHVGEGEESMRNYPTEDDLVEHVPKYPIPFFFHFGVFRDNLLISYMLGIGVDSQQVYSLTFDFINIFIMTAYIFEFRNPILNKNLKKVFWQFPTKDETQQWSRLEKIVQRQVDWIHHPKPLYKDGTPLHKYKDVESELSKDQKKLADAQYKFALHYNHENQYDLNYMLTNYVDIKFQTIWGEEFIKEKKQEIKKNCIYFRLVKQGSQLVYISFHIITIFMVLLMAAMRQSLFAFMYVIILLPKMQDGAAVLKQRDIMQGKELEDVDHDIDDLNDTLKQTSVKDTIVKILKEKMGKSVDEVFSKTEPHLNKQIDQILRFNNEEIEQRERDIMLAKNLNVQQFQDYTHNVLQNQLVDNDDRETLILLLVKKHRRLSGDAVDELLQKLRDLNKKKYKIQKSFQKKNAQLKKKDRDQIAKSQWSMINTMKLWLLTYALIDSSIQILFQMPIVDLNKINRLRQFGFRKVWSFNPGNQQYDQKPDTFSKVTYDDYIFCKAYNEDGTHTGNCPKYVLDQRAFNFQMMNAFIVAIILLQSEIFSSPGYLKYVTQPNGSMDLLMQLSDVKAKAMTYVFNNYKIRKILSINRKREATLKTVERLKEKITRWRQFTRTTLVSNRDPSLFVETGASKPEEPKQHVKVEKQQSEKTGKEVTFGEKDVVIDNNQEQQDSEEEEEDEFVREQKRKELLHITPEEREFLHLTLATEFVRSKMGKQRICVKLYLWLQNTFVDKIMFKNSRSELEALKQKLAEGSIHVPTELESLMIIEAQEFIKNSYDNKEGSEELVKLLRMRRDQSQNLLSLTGFDKKIKLNQLKMTWDFTRTLPLMLHFIETFAYMMISQSQNLIYFFMIYSMYMNAGIISIPYPIAVFGWAILEERRPGKKFWLMVRYYTVFLVALKFILNLDFFDKYLQDEAFKTYSSYVKTGIYNMQNLSDLINYMLPEIAILCFLMLHEIKLQLIGLYDKNEEDIETVLDGIERNLHKGDEEAVKARKIEIQNMCMARYFEKPQEQKERQAEFLDFEKNKITEDLMKQNAVEILRNENYGHLLQNQTVSDVKTQDVIDKLVDYEMHQQFPQDASLLEKQQQLFKEISKSIIKTSTRYDLDSVNKASKFDDYIRFNVFQKTLENDHLTFVEGMRPKQQSHFMTVRQFAEEKAKKENWEVFSSGDFKEDMLEKFDSIDDRELNNPGWFERREYFDRLFPAVKVQKPGYDLYGTTTLILGILAIYVFLYYDSFNYSWKRFEYGQQSVLFPFSMASQLLLIITVIIIERYANRSDTKKIEEKRTIGDEEEDKKKTFFSNDDMFKRTTTQRSMTVKLKTVKTSDLDMGSSAAQDFLSSFGQDDNEDDVDDGRTKITNQQKTKYFIHWFMLIYGLAYCFWYAPIVSNLALYGQAACNEEQKKFYGCYNFKDNDYIRFLAILYFLYSMVSGAQIAYGFPILKKASSVFQYYNDIGMITAQVYAQIPFVIEIRCLLDFTFSKTSLDVFQFWQLFFYHWEMFVGWTGNRYYTIKTLGSPTECFDKFIFGVLISSGLLFLLMGPFYLFSTWSPLVGFNPVIQGQFSLNLQINKTVAFNPEAGDVQFDVGDGKLNYTYDRMQSSMPYKLYTMSSPYLKKFTEGMWKDSKYYNKTETRDFEPDNIQFCVLRRHSDLKMNLSPMSLKDLNRDILLKKSHPHALNISLQQDYSFARSQPFDALNAFYLNNRSLEQDYLNDCLTVQELANWAEFDCGLIRDKSLSHSIIFTQAFNPALVLGQNKFVTEVKEKQKTDTDLKHDIKMTYFCDDSWDVRATINPTQYTKLKATDGQDASQLDEFGARKVDPLTCDLLNADLPIDDAAVLEMKNSLGLEDTPYNRKEYFAFLREDGHWSPIVFILFSMKVATGFIASYTPSTFYFVLVYGLSATVRGLFIFSTWAGYTYELTNPEPMMKLIECCYMMRHEENLIAEEECYRMLQEIIRQPQLYKQLSGTSLTGSMHPDLDHLNKEQKKKLAQLDNLERKGWDVASLKYKIIKGDRKIDDDF